MKFRVNWTLLDAIVSYYLVVIHCICSVSSSEFPERECCDTVYSSPPNSEPVQPTSITHILPSSITGNHTGSKEKIAILSCILARQLCFEDPSCSAILEIIPRVCGPVPVACSTVTVTKCLAALKTLQAFPFFRPTCLCKEPGLDPECNNFRDFLFDHPCGVVIKREKDPYPIDALPTCNHALSVCQQSPKCIELFESFKTHCKVRDNKCRMDDKNACYDAWAKLRLSPMFGCICPNNHMKRRCDRIFSMVNHNPCVAHSMSFNHLMDQIFDDTIIDNKITAINAKDMKNHHDFLYPYNLTVFKIMPTLDNIRIIPGSDTDRYENVPQITTGSNPDAIQLTCDVVYQTCKDDLLCMETLKPVLHYCDFQICNRNACLDALQTFYRVSNEDFALDIAFCVCNKMSHRNDACLRAQEKMHPTCAKNPELIDMNGSNGVIYSATMPACHTNAEICREDPMCRSRLEHYEQACAIDSSTLKCAGHTSSCRMAILGIIGTPLRMTCSCHNTDSVYECLGWYRLLWLNTCVAEAQLDFHSKRLNEISIYMASKPDANTIPPSTTALITMMTSTPSIIWTTTTTTTTLAPVPQSLTTVSTTTSTKSTKSIHHSRISKNPRMNWRQKFLVGTTTTSSTAAHTTSTQPTNLVKNEPQTSENSVQKILDYNSVSDDEKNESAIDMMLRKSTTTTTEQTTTPEPRFCIVQRPRQTDQSILVNSARRIYSLDDAECSELCFCTNTLVLTCHALCVPFTPCRTALAFYSHASPAFQAYRGRCLCYSGNFICIRQPGELKDFKLPGGGIYLLLGYSSIDEELLRAYTNLGVQDTVRAFQQYLHNHIDNQTSCILQAYNITDENIIITVKLPNTNEITETEVFERKKNECREALEQISYDINSQSNELAAHQLLSVYKMAEVLIVPPEFNGSSIAFVSLTLLLLVTISASTPFTIHLVLC